MDSDTDAQEQPEELPLGVPSDATNSAAHDKSMAMRDVLQLENRKKEVTEIIKRFDFEALGDLFREAMEQMEESEPQLKDDLDYEGDWGLQTVDAERCLFDKKRTELFKNAIESVVHSGDTVLEANVSPGDVVVEAGAGTGILALIAAVKGAKKVYAVEINPNTVRVCNQFIKFCGFEGTIEVIHGDATTFVPPEKVDVIMSENMYTGLLEEPQQQIMNNLLQHLKSGGRVVPKKLESFIELVEAPDEQAKSKVRRELSDAINIVSDPEKYDDVSFEKQEPLDLDTRVTIKANKDATINAVNISSLIYLTDDIRIKRDECDFLGNDEVIYLNEPVTVEQGKQYSIHIRYNGGDKSKDALIEVEAV